MSRSAPAHALHRGTPERAAQLVTLRTIERVARSVGVALPGTYRGVTVSRRPSASRVRRRGVARGCAR